MLRLGTAFLAFGVGFELFGILNRALPSSPIVQLLGFVSLTLSLILLILGLPFMRNLVN